MGAVLIRSSFSANIKERRDCSTALFDERGRMIAQAEHIPVHLGAMPDAVAAVMRLGLEPGAGRDPQRPVHGRHAPARRDARLAHRARLRGLARPPRGRRRDRAGEPARVLAHARRGGRDPAAAAPHRRRARALRRARRGSRRSAAATSAPSSPRTGSPSGGSRSCARGAGGDVGRRCDGRALRVLRADGARRARRAPGRARRGRGRRRGGRRRPADPVHGRDRR